jgi:hypothetical protein
MFWIDTQQDATPKGKNQFLNMKQDRDWEESSAQT